MAAAVAGRAEAIVTWNEKDFTCEFVSNHAVTVVNPDIYLSSLYREFPAEVLSTITRIAAGKRRPPMTGSSKLAGNLFSADYCWSCLAGCGE